LTGIFIKLRSPTSLTSFRGGGSDLSSTSMLLKSRISFEGLSIILKQKFLIFSLEVFRLSAVSVGRNRVSDRDP
jgi:hypothetical protein